MIRLGFCGGATGAARVLGWTLVRSVLFSFERASKHHRVAAVHAIAAMLLRSTDDMSVPRLLA